MTGSRIVALGGGHGLAAALRAARLVSDDVVGIVSVADDGGSSGRLRAELGVPALGDIRRCLSAVAAEDSLLARSLEHRFDQGALYGHPIGNLLLAGLTVASGDLEAAVAEVARLVGAEGRILPATSSPVTLVADSDNGTLLGQVTIEDATQIRNLRFNPSRPPASVAAVEAISTADLVVIGPGSLFTSVLACAVVPGLTEAIAATSARRVFVSNIATDRAEARDFDLAAHVGALLDHGVEVDVVLAPLGSGAVDGAARGIPVVEAALAADDGWHHDPKRLADAFELVRS